MTWRRQVVDEPSRSAPTRSAPHGPRLRGPRKFLEVVGFRPAAGTEFTAVAVTMAAAETAMSAVPTPPRIPPRGVVATHHLVPQSWSVRCRQGGLKVTKTYPYVGWVGGFTPFEV